MNLQNVPFLLEQKDIELVLNLKDVFIADSDEYELYDLDIANAEMRVLCAYSQDKTMIDVFNSGLDMHCKTGSNPKVSNFTYEDILAHKDDKTSQQYVVRQASKKINFGVVYVIGAQGLKRQLYNELGLDISEEVCEEYINGFLDTYPGVRSYMNWVRMFVRQFGYIYTLTGRRRRFPLMEYDRKGLGKVMRQAINAPVQSTSSDLVLRNIINLNNTIKKLGGRIILTVHDSILFQLPKGLLGVKKMLDDVIVGSTAREFPWLPVAWKYDVAKGSTYGHCKLSVT